MFRFLSQMNLQVIFLLWFQRRRRLWEIDKRGGSNKRESKQKRKKSENIKTTKSEEVRKREIIVQKERRKCGKGIERQREWENKWRGGNDKQRPCLPFTCFCCADVMESTSISVNCRRKLASDIMPRADFQLTSLIPLTITMHSQMSCTALGGLANDLQRWWKKEEMKQCKENKEKRHLIIHIWWRIYGVAMFSEFLLQISGKKKGSFFFQYLTKCSLTSYKTKL